MLLNGKIMGAPQLAPTKYALDSFPNSHKSRLQTAGISKASYVPQTYIKRLICFVGTVKIGGGTVGLT